VAVANFLFMLSFVQVHRIVVTFQRVSLAPAAFLSIFSGSEASATSFLRMVSDTGSDDVSLTVYSDAMLVLFRFVSYPAIASHPLYFSAQYAAYGGFYSIQFKSLFNISLSPFLIL
jgi:hypothetical protein